MFVTRSKELHERARHLRSHGMTSLTLDRYEGRSISYDVVQPGLNYRIDELRAAIGLVQLEKLPEANRQRGELVKRYRQLLDGVFRVQVPFQSHNIGKPSYHIFPILLDESLSRRTVIEGLKKHGVQSSVHYPAFQEFIAYRESGLNGAPIASDISRRELTLPLFATMTLAQVEYVSAALKQFVA